ncbi:MAG: DUF4325 domain-containing protein [Clostridia bacterium]|nr:DUF4325 domain-containing protein [Clostridia bacterium]
MKANKEKIKLYLLQHIDLGDRDYAMRAIKTFGISKSTAYNYVKELLAEGLIQKNTAEESFPYFLTTESIRFYYKATDRLEEDRLFHRDVSPLLADLPENVRRAWYYAFTEMMNNAIEHSEAQNILCKVKKNHLNTTIYIADDGIGIFENIRRYIKETEREDVTPDDCAGLLLAGKFTTKRANHSGEGIFFTSHLMDSFVIASAGKIYTRNTFLDLTVDEDRLFDQGTTVGMKLSNHSKKVLRDVFDSFSDEDGMFVRTHIPIAHMFTSGSPVSRSEARRLLGLIAKFKEVTLDFNGVDEIGQAFAHELFAVSRRLENPPILQVQHANKAVTMMINRVTAEE